MSDFEIRAGDRLPIIAATITDGRPEPDYPFGRPISLVGASARFIMRRLDGRTPLLDAPAQVTDAAGGKVAYAWAAGDTATPGAYLAEWQITFADGRRLTVPNGSGITVDARAGVADGPPITAGDVAAIRGHIGHQSPPTDAELAIALARLGSVDAVALEVLDGRYAEMISAPAKWSVAGDFDLDNTVSISALSAKLDDLKGRLAIGPVMTVGTLSRADRSGSR